MQNWTIGRRLAVGFSVLVLLSGVLSGVFLYSLAGINEDINSITTDNIPGVIYSNEVMRGALNYRVLTLRHVAATDVEEMRAIDADCLAVANATLEDLKKYEASVVTAEERALSDKIRPAFESYRELSRSVRELSLAGKPAEALKLANERKQVFLDFEKTVLDCVDYNRASAAKASDEIRSVMASARTTTVVLALTIAALAAAAGVYITVSINRAIRRVAGNLGDASSQVSAASQQVSASSQSLAEGSSEQAASLEETSASLEEINGMTSANAESAKNAKSVAEQTRVAADEGNTQMQQMITAMDAIKASSDNIAKIIKTIDEIAFQTNIPALTAAVEAARAGDAGAGFAVVADEVRSLAQRAAQAAKETAEKIDDSITKSASGVDLSGRVAASLKQIGERARQMDEIVGEIATASAEQSRGINQVNQAVSQMDKVTQSNAGNAEETAAAAEELNAQAASLLESVAELSRLVGRTAASSGPVAPKKVAQKFAAIVSKKAPVLPSASASRPARAPHAQPVATAAVSDAHFLDS
jgi:methyl-accepting chemotaxis protein